MPKKLCVPLGKDDARSLKAGETVLLNGLIYTARDAAHKRMAQVVKKGRGLPFDIRHQVIYYAGPAPTPPGRTFGSCGPTTSSRMDAFTPSMLGWGLKGMIGKGKRSREVAAAIKKYGAVYFVAIGGAGAFYSKRIKSARVIAYRDLGPEAIHELEVKDFPVIVGIDSRGRDIFK